MNDAWEILRLDPATADEKQVRSAYARLLKLNRPDQNPAGFQQLRDAYEHALQWLRRPREEEDEIDALLTEAEASAAKADTDKDHEEAAPPPATHQSKSPPDREWPHQWSYSLYALNAALKKTASLGSREANPDIRAALEALAVDAREQYIPAAALVIMIEDAFDFHDRFHTFAHAAPDLLLLRLLEDGGADIVRRTLSHLEGFANSPRMASLASFLTAQEAALWDESNADIAFRILRAIAFHRPALAEKLAQILHGQIDPIKHAADFEEVATRIKQGHMFRNIRAESRQFWGERLAAGPVPPPCDWSTGPARIALYDAIFSGPHWSGFETARSLVPADVWDNAWRQRHLLKYTTGTRRILNGIHQSSYLGIIAFILAFFGIRSCQQIQIRPPNPLPPKTSPLQR